MTFFQKKDSKLKKNTQKRKISRVYSIQKKNLDHLVRHGLKTFFTYVSAV
jgi:hypothetical protein